MKIKSKWLVFAFMSFFFSSATVMADHFDGHVDVKTGPLTPKALAGQQVFNQQCASCHGDSGAGTMKGPPLIHDIYNPGHHGNNSFIKAVKVGVKQHHWPYGDMPPQPNIGFSDMTAIIHFIREVQAANGVVKRQHKMR